MVEPLFRFDDPMVVGADVVLAGEEGHHAAAVRRMKAGEPVQLTDGAGTRARGVVSQVDKRTISVRLETVDSETNDAHRLTLVQAIAKGDRDELAIQAATELGVATIVPWQADRSVSKWDGKEQKGKARWQSIVDEASKQSLRVWFPDVLDAVASTGLANLVESRVAGGEVVLVLDPTATSGISNTRLTQGAGVMIIVGPEGGISEVELGKLHAAGAKSVSLGRNILRTSTAGMAAISWFKATIGAWD